MKYLLGLAIATMISVAPATAHRLIIYAYAEAGDVVVESKFSNGRPAVAGEITIADAEGAELLSVPMAPTGTTRIPLPKDGSDGITVTVTTDQGHSDYWVLTPADLGKVAQ